jgi:hypothetical protein
MRLGIILMGLAVLTGSLPALKAQQNGVFVPPTVIPKNFKTRKVGATLNITAIGTARNITVKAGQAPLVELAINGKTTRTFPGNVVNVGGLNYKAMGWQKDHFLLFSATKRKSLYFSRAETAPVSASPKK